MNKKGQNAIEYMLIFVAIVVVIVIAVAPNGFITQAVNESIDLAIGGLEDMAANVQNE